MQGRCSIVVATVIDQCCSTTAMIKQELDSLGLPQACCNMEQCVPAVRASTQTRQISGSTSNYPSGTLTPATWRCSCCFPSLRAHGCEDTLLPWERHVHFSGSAETDARLLAAVGGHCCLLTLQLSSQGLPRPQGVRLQPPHAPWQQPRPVHSGLTCWQGPPQHQQPAAASRHQASPSCSGSSRQGWHRKLAKQMQR